MGLSLKRRAAVRRPVHTGPYWFPQGLPGTPRDQPRSSPVALEDSQAPVLRRAVAPDAVLLLEVLHDVPELLEGLEGLFGFLDGELGVVLLVPLRTLVDRQTGTRICRQETHHESRLRVWVPQRRVWVPQRVWVSLTLHVLQLGVVGRQQREDPLGLTVTVDVQLQAGQHRAAGDTGHGDQDQCWWCRTHVVQGRHPGVLPPWPRQQAQAPLQQVEGWKVERRPALQRLTWPSSSSHSLASTQLPACRDGLTAFAWVTRRHRHKTGVTAVPSCSIPVEGESTPVRGYPQGKGSTPSGDRHNRLLLLRAGRSLAEQDFQRTVYSQYFGFWSHRPCT
ncbi:hypothetical protein EYF80_049021 [Liparis tanakae]|uniref:Uncharacterized protein n=1 Tax=Liparis tanakae TaxID=230148 RepID=A0A4Z2FHV6_9TELE|nr:hypothetical protein EYF80_049021 [Liparis tanakae]